MQSQRHTGTIGLGLPVAVVLGLQGLEAQSGWAQKLYWGDPRRGDIYCSNPDGTDTERVGGVSHSEALISSIGFDHDAEMLYWSELSATLTQVTGTMLRAAPGKASPETIRTEQGRMFTFLRIDPVEQKLYWAVPRSGQFIQRSNLDGTGFESLTDVSFLLGGLDLDVAARSMYVCTVDRLQRGNLDGSNLKEVIPDITCTHPAVDPIQRRLYFAARDPSDLLFGIYRSHLGGGSFERLTEAVFQSVGGLAVDPYDQVIYWIDRDPGGFRRPVLHWANSEGNDLGASPMPAGEDALDLRFDPVARPKFALLSRECQNQVRLQGGAFVTLALFGSVTFDAHQVDVPSLVLARRDGVGEPVRPELCVGSHRDRLADVGSPERMPDACEIGDRDGVADLSVVFAAQELVMGLDLENAPAGMAVEVEVRASLRNARPVRTSGSLTVASQRGRRP